MDNYTNQDLSLLENLLTIPRINLEKKVKQLETEIMKRQQINDLSLSELSTQQLQLKEQAERSNYLIPAIQQSSIFKRQIWQLEVQILKEKNDNFKTISELTDKLQQTKEELNMSRLKFELLN